MALKQGYLAGVFKSEKVAIGSSDVVHLLAGTNGVSGLFSNAAGLALWDQTPGTGTITWGATYGYNEFSGGVKIVAIAADVVLAQTITLDTALVEAKKVSANLWAKLATTKTATLTVTFKTAAGATIGTPSVLTITANNANYGDTNWGYWSMFLTAPVTTKSILVEIEPTSAQTLYVDNVDVVCLRQIIGAHDQLSIDLEAEREDVTTFKSAQDEHGFRNFETHLINAGEIQISNYWGVQKVWSAAITYVIGDVVQHGGRSYTCILASTNNAPPNVTYWTVLGSESHHTELLSGEKVFVIIFTDVAAVDERFEFWAKVPKAGITAPLAGMVQNPFTLTVDGIVGFVDRAKD
jgi:hypothetical protein